MPPDPAPRTPTAACPVCHQPVLPSYYFCPNCGANLHPKPLSTSISTQLGIYAFSIILPMICFVAVTKWPGMKYYRSEDPKVKQIGAIAWILLVLSTLVTLYYAYYAVEQTIQDAQAQINQDMSF